MERNWFTFGGYDSRDFGIYISGSGTFDAPEREYETAVVPGRNGALLMTMSRIDNVEVDYPAYIYSDFKAKIAAMRSAFLGLEGYQRLTDSYHPDEYRLAYFEGDIKVKTTKRLDAGSFTLTFVCKPQRYLVDGEQPVEIGTTWGELTTMTGALVTFDGKAGDAFKSLTTNIDPVQSLNGYDHPWAGGAGNNIMPGFADGTSTSKGITFVYGDGDATELTYTNDISITGTSTAINADSPNKTIGADGDTVGISLATGESVTVKIIPTNSSPAIPKIRIFLEKADNTAITYFDSETATWTYTATEDITINRIRLRVPTNGSVINLVGKVMIVKGTTAPTEYEPYENVCPISGHTQANVTRAGKNLLHIFKNTGGKSTNGITYTVDVDAGTVTANGTATANADIIVTDSTINLPNGTYVLSGGISANQWIRIQVDGTLYQSSSSDSNSFTVTDDTVFGNCYCRVLSGQTVSNAVFKPMIRLVSDTDATFDPYKGTTYAVSFGSAGTVYGGTVDVVSGVLTVDRVGADMGSLTWYRSTSYSNPIFYTTITGKASNYKNAACSMFRNIGSSTIIAAQGFANNSENGDFASSNGNAQVFVRMDAVTAANDFKTAVTGQTLVYPLATPITYQLTPAQITTLLGVNNVWADTGDVMLQYGTSPFAMVNPTQQTARPLIRVYGYGTLVVGDCTVTIASHAYTYIDIDCDIMDCHYGTTNCNSLVSFSTHEFPTFPPGVTWISFNNTITKVEVEPDWWRA